MTQLCVVKNPMRYNFMDRQVIQNNFVNTLTQVMYGCKTTWVSLSFLVDCNSLLLYLFHYWIYLQGIIFFFICCIITLIITSVLPGTTFHFKKYSHVLWTRQKIFIVCYYLFTFTFISVVILFFVSVLTPSDWEEAEIHMKCKGILRKAM